MNIRAGDDFEELEPRVTPQPTLLKCTTAPSVPEVSMIFGKNPVTTEDYKEFRTTPVKDYETYANWKKDEYPTAILTKTDSPHARRSFDKSPRIHNATVLPRKSTFDESTNFRAITVDKNVRDDSPQNQRNPRPNYNKNFPQRDNNRDNQIRNTSNDNHARHKNYENYSQNQITDFSSFRNKIVDSPISKKSHDVVKSILKSSTAERTELTEQSSNNDRRSIKKYGSCGNSQSPRNLVVSEFTRSSSASHSCNRKIDVDDRETVRDLLTLVKNQNEQIKSLQNQVERLLKVHEESMGNRTMRSNEIKLSPVRNVDDVESSSSVNVVSPQKSRNNQRSMKIVAPSNTDETAELRLRYQTEQMRNTIVEKKVSIGVMTSFEFSVHNNPFVADSDNPVNAVLRECEKNITENADNWRANVSSRNIIPGPLENINEDSEGYPSSLWKQSNNTTQSSSMEKLNSKKIAIINENKIYNENLTRVANKNNDERVNGNWAGNVANKSTQPPIPAPRRSLTNNRKPENNFQSAERRNYDYVDSGNCDLNYFRERESYGLNRGENANVCDRGREEIIKDFYADGGDCFPRDGEFFKTRMKSMATKNTDEGSLVLSSSDLRVNERPPSPDPSIHVEMREYSSDDDDEKTKIAPPVGWTFYKNIVGQVNRILHTIPDAKDRENEEFVGTEDVRREIEGREEAVDSVKLATLERLKMLGVSYAEHSEFTGEHVQKKVTFDSSYCPRLDYQTISPQPASTVAESNTSMHMKALALKYLSDEQLAELAVQKQGDDSGGIHKMLNNVHATNMSLATMNYLQRYCMVSGVNTSHAEGKEHFNAIRQKKLKQVVMTKEVHAQPMPRHQNFNDSATKKGPDNILDITTLKQQPKLL